MSEHANSPAGTATSRNERFGLCLRLDKDINEAISLLSSSDAGQVILGDIFSVLLKLSSVVNVHRKYTQAIFFTNINYRNNFNLLYFFFFPFDCRINDESMILRIRVSAMPF